MKKSNFKILLSSLWVLVCGYVQAQTNVNMADNGVTVGSPFSIAPPATCFFNFYDHGGPAGNYNNSANANVTFLPSDNATHRIQATFTLMALEVNFDAFYIFNSNTVGVNQVPGPQGATIFGFPAGNWQNISPGTITANTGIAAVGANAAEALTFQFRSDGSVVNSGWAAIVRQVPKAACAMIAPTNKTAFTGPNAIGCFTNVNTELPNFNPGGCQAGYQLRYRINGGLPTVVLDPVSTNIPAPVGSNIITWELVDPCGGGVITSANQLITVNDNTLPVVNCPSNVTINLGPGECRDEFNYNVSCSDNCPFNVASTVTTPIDFNNGHAGIMFDLVNLSGAPVTITQFGPTLSAGTWNMEVYFTHTANTWVGNQSDASAWTLAGTNTVLSAGPGAGTPVPGFGITIPAGQSRGIYLTSSSGLAMFYKDGSREVNDGILQINSNPGAGKAYPFGTTFFDRSYTGYVKYTTTVSQAPVQLTGLVSGSDFEIGVTTNTFRCTDAAGNSSTCSFTVTVTEYPNPTWSLTCNDFILVALGDDCYAEVGADDVLEGGPYRCYEKYIVEIDKIAPFGNGPWVPAILTAADVGKTYKVRVTEPTTGNKCSGDLKVIDGEPPHMFCTPSPVTIPCNMSTDPQFFSNSTMTLRFPVAPDDLFETVVDFETHEFDIPVLVPPGVVVEDVDFLTKITGDAFFNNLRIQVESPSGTIVTIWNQLGGCAPAPIFARFDDEGSAILACETFSTGINAQIPFGFGLLSDFDGEQANGVWKIRVQDMDANADISTVEKAELYIKMTGTFGTGFPNGISPLIPVKIGANTYSVPAGLVDDCSPVTLSFFDQKFNQTCASPYTQIIHRRWTAVDESGNTTACTQVINLLRATHADVTPAPDYDDVDLPGFMCEGGAYPTPDWIENQGLTGYPLVFGLPDNCEMTWTHNDVKVPICEGAYNILRTWTVIDPCGSPTSKEWVQNIHVRDTMGPTFLDCPLDMIETTDPFTCCATFTLPDALVEDNCGFVYDVWALIFTINPYNGDTISITPVSGGAFNFPGNLPNDPDTLAAFGNMPCIPIGQHVVVYYAEDGCGNIGTCSFNLTIADFAPPQPSCDETTIVSIGVDDPFDCYYTNQATCEFAGITWVHAETFDDGSYDQCSPIKFTIRRAPPYSDCIQALDKEPCFGASNHDDLSEYEIATLESDSIKFY
ncbi:MAG: HYR domain-containing protein, partial [Saprospiraceae bacterium]|nr:HYR domain-containing protein [Saprospiraceae bacterium]